MSALKFSNEEGGGDREDGEREMVAGLKIHSEGRKVSYEFCTG